MARTIISSVGTSLLGNFKRVKGTDSEKPEELARYAREDLRAASAELNVIGRLNPLKDDRFVFLHSDTTKATLCATAQCLVMKNRFDCEAEEKSVPHLTGKSSSFDMGLRSYVNTLLEVISDAQKRQDEVLLNANGGFKPQSALTALIGFIFELPVYYIHDEFEELVVLPRVPMSWDISQLIVLEPVLRKIDEGVSQAELEALLGQYSPQDAAFLRSIVDTADADCVVLTPIGLALFSRYSQIDLFSGTNIWLSQKAKEDLEAIIDAKTREVIKGLLSKVGNPQMRSHGIQKHSSDCQVLPPGGHTAARVAFFETGGRVTVARIFTRHQDYERDLDAGLIMSRDHAPWVEYET